PAFIIGHNLIAGTVKTQGIAERNMKVQRQWALAQVTVGHRFKPFILQVIRPKLWRCGVRCVPWPTQVVAVDNALIPCERFLIKGHNGQLPDLKITESIELEVKRTAHSRSPECPILKSIPGCIELWPCA